MFSQFLTITLALFGCRALLFDETGKLDAKSLMLPGTFISFHYYYFITAAFVRYSITLHNAASYRYVDQFSVFFFKIKPSIRF